MITHYINISNSGVSELYLNVSLNTDAEELCCEDSVDVRVYQTNDPGQKTWTNPSEYFLDQIPLQPFVEAVLVPEVPNLGIPLDGTATGLHLAFVVSAPGACITITRIVLFYYACPEKVEDLVKFPETVAPTMESPEAVLVEPNCTSNAKFASSVEGQLECHALGVWQSNEIHCLCDRGYFLSGGSSSQTCQGDHLKYVLNVEEKVTDRNLKNLYRLLTMHDFSACVYVYPNFGNFCGS